jgi:hypothetical protein
MARRQIDPGCVKTRAMICWPSLVWGIR